MHKSIVFAALALIVTCGLTAGVAEAGDAQIAVLISGPGAPYDLALAGMKQHLDKSGIKAEYAVHQLGGDAGKAAQVVQDLKANKPGLIVTLGSLATEKVVREIPDVPVVAAMILKADALKKAGNATGVFLEFPVETQFQWMKKFLPKARTIGVVFNPAENRERVEHAARLAQKMGLTLNAQEVSAPKDLPAALDKLANSADALWGIADATALNPQTAKLILLFSFRNHVPFIGPSPAWVKAGALYSLDWDYADMGAQCGEAAVKIFQGASAGSIPPAPPRKILYSLNRKTAEDMGLKFPEDVVREAPTIF